MENNTAIGLAAGRGKRMNSSIQKQFMDLGGYPVLYYSLRCFQDSPLIRDIILVAGEEEISYCKSEIVERYGFSKVCAVVPGGRERYDSVYAGLCACSGCDYVVIHDGARPFVTEEILRRGMEGVRATGACVAGMPSKDTVKLMGDDGCISGTLNRDRVWIIQTPQIFSYSIVRSAYDKLQDQDKSHITDDAMVVERNGEASVRLVEGSYRNIKITTPEDLEVGEIYLKKGNYVLTHRKDGARINPALSQLR